MGERVGRAKGEGPDGILGAEKRSFIWQRTGRFFEGGAEGFPCGFPGPSIVFVGTGGGGGEAGAGEVVDGGGEDAADPPPVFPPSRRVEA